MTYLFIAFLSALWAVLLTDWLSPVFGRVLSPLLGAGFGVLAMVVMLVVWA